LAWKKLRMGWKKFRIGLERAQKLPGKPGKVREIWKPVWPDTLLHGAFAF
jgi:hypothetical protein